VALQKAVLRAANDPDPGKRIVGAHYAHAAAGLAKRGYIKLTPCKEGLWVEFSDLVLRKYCRQTKKHGLWIGIHGWRRFPQLRQ
jgi:hypothetical protein